MPLTPVRARLADLMRDPLADEAAHHTWTYLAVRPLAVPPRWVPGMRINGDCSKGCQFLVYWASDGDKRLDPMGNGYADWGNSTTICAHLQHLGKPSQLAVGDMVTFGENGDQHAAMVLEPGDDPLLWSFGHQGAPNTYRLSEDHRPYQLLRLPTPRYIPSKADKLRARTGYWAWLQWSLGEGDWRKHKPADRSVRPHVPRRIPVSWWWRRMRFLLARRKPNPVGTHASRGA